MNVAAVNEPLAEQLRPKTLQQICGQEQLLGPDGPLSTSLAQGQLYSLILWGPPGTGKTTLARVIATTIEARFHALSAVSAGVKDVRAAIAEAGRIRQQGHRTILFLDEVHRFNKAQQDSLLPYIEDGTILFIGATTENPAFEINRALLSRLRIHILKPLDGKALRQILQRALDYLGQCGKAVILNEEATVMIVDLAAGDGRRLLGLLETAVALAHPKGDGIHLGKQEIITASGEKVAQFDKGGDFFYDLISALHKSIRGSSPDAALYWFCRMLAGGCDPNYIARRLLRIASEDIGNADPRALWITSDAWEAYRRLGSPEGELALAQAVLYLSSAAKSNAAYNAFKAAMADAKQFGSVPVPLALRNAPTKLARSQGHGTDYRYAHNEPGGFAAGMKYLPPEMDVRHYYRPVDRGLEQQIASRLESFRQLDQQYWNAQNRSKK